MAYREGNGPAKWIIGAIVVIVMVNFAIAAAFVMG
jgi:hypothetical protein